MSRTASQLLTDTPTNNSNNSINNTMKKKILFLAIAAGMLLFTSCDPVPDKPESYVINLPGNMPAELYNRCNALLGKNEAEVAAMLTEWGYAEVPEFANDSNVTQAGYRLENEVDSLTKITSSYAIYFGHTGQACFIRCNWREQTYASLSERMQCLRGDEFVKAVGETLTMSTGETPAFRHYENWVAMYDVPRVTDDYETALRYISERDSAQQIYNINEVLYETFWGDSILYRDLYTRENLDKMKNGKLNVVHFKVQNTPWRDERGIDAISSQFDFDISSKKYGVEQ